MIALWESFWRIWGKFPRLLTDAWWFYCLAWCLFVIAFVL